MIKDCDLVSVQEVRDIVEKATVAFEEAKKLSQEQIDKIVKHMAEVGEKHAEELARMAVQETGYGNASDKTTKNLVSTKKLYDYIKDMKTVGIVNEDKNNKILEIAIGVGVVAGLVPSTNPSSTAFYKSIICVKSANPIVLSPHPSAKKTIQYACKLMNDAVVEAGGPNNMCQCIITPNMAGTKALMTHDGVKMILATGGKDMVKAAYSSGVPALGVGPGNVPVFIEKTADIDKAISKILESKTFDNGVICASEQAIVTEDCIKDKVVSSLKNQGCYFLNDDEAKKVASVITKSNGKLNPAIVGKTAHKIAQMSGLNIPDSTRCLVYEEKGVGDKYPFSIEKLSPILALYSESDVNKISERCIELLEFGGIGHTMGMHSNNETLIREFAVKMPVSRFLINTPTTQGAIGATTSLAPALTLGCGSIGGSATSDNVTPLNLINIKRAAYDLDKNSLSSSDSTISGVSSSDIDKITKLVIDAIKLM